MLQKEYNELKPAFDLLISDYHSGKKRLSYSSFKSFMEGGPRGFFKNRMIKEQSEAMLQGIAFHMCVLEPEKYEKTYYVFDDTEKVNELIANGSKSARSTKDYKEWKANYILKFNGMEEVTRAEDEMYKSFKDYLRVNTMTKKYMESIEETEKLINFEFYGFNWTCKVDGVASHQTIDIKKAANAHPKKMKWAIRDMHYDLQGVVCCIAAERESHAIISIDKSHTVSVFILEGENMEVVKDKMCYYIKKFRECIEVDAWDQGVNFFVNEPEILVY